MACLIFGQGMGPECRKAIGQKEELRKGLCVTVCLLVCLWVVGWNCCCWLLLLFRLSLLSARRRGGAVGHMPKTPGK